MKPSEDAPISCGLFLADLLRDAGLPGGVLNVVTDDLRETGDLVSALIADPRVRLVNFTGSTKLGRIIGTEAAKNLKPAVLAPTCAAHSPTATRSTSGCGTRCADGRRSRSPTGAWTRRCSAARRSTASSRARSKTKSWRGSHQGRTTRGIFEETYDAFQWDRVMRRQHVFDASLFGSLLPADA